MSDSSTKRMITAYIQMAGPTLFLQGLFQSPPVNFHNTEEVEIDIIRSDEEVAIVIQDLSTGHRMNADDLYTNKGFKPPIFKEAVALNAFDLLKRMPGDNPFENPNFRASLITRMFNSMVKIENKIRRSLELQASQVLQTGIVTLVDENGVTLYSLDYKPKATHFPTAGIAWGLATSVPLDDLNALALVIRKDGLRSADELIFGSAAWNAFVQDDSVKALLDNRRMDLGAVVPQEKRDNGGTYKGWIQIGNYRFDMWTYDGMYNHPQTGAKTEFIDPGNVVMRDSSGRLDATFGAIPNIGKLLGEMGPNLLPELPGRISNAAGGMDLHANAWLSENGEQLFGGVGARPLMIPTAIDTYGCLTTGL